MGIRAHAAGRHPELPAAELLAEFAVPVCFWPIATRIGQIIPAASVIAALLAATLWALRRAPALGFLGAWFFLILAPTSSFVPIVTEVAAERRMYLPLAAVVADAS